MFGNPLDNMLSQYGQRSNDPVSSLTAAPTPTTSPTGGPGSFFSAASNVTAGGSSIGSSPFGQGIPDISKLTSQQLDYITKTLSGFTYSVPLGGYIPRDQANDANSVYNKGYYNMKVALPSQRPIQDAYNMIGNLPTRPLGTPALNSFPGYSPTPGPSYNDRLGAAGPYGGPWSFPGWP